MATPPSRPHYSKFYWKDWESKTQDLDPYEYTAYHRLLGYAKLNSPDFCSIPDDDIRLARIVRFGIKRWRSVARKVLDMWLLRGDHRYEHRKLREEADEWFQVSMDQRKRRTGGQPADDRWLTGGQPARALVRSQKLETEESKSTPLVPDGTEEGFDTLWKLYPHYGRRSLRAKSLLRWKGLRPRPPIREVVDGLEACKVSDEWIREGGRFVPGLQVWIRDRGWDASDGSQGGEVDSEAEVRSRLVRAEIRRLEEQNGTL